MDELIKLSARQAVGLLAQGEISPLELIDAAEKRMAQVDGLVNALPTLCLERARKKAREVMALPNEDKPPWFLHGLPMVVKDLSQVAGVRTTFGSRAFRDHVPQTTDPEIALLERNGALVLAKSNTPEFGAGANTFNEVFGVTKNPWDLGKTCAGSSGGSAVALATGMAWLATGSDLGGSLRTPAGFCSVCGLRPTPGLVPMAGAAAWQNLFVNGPMARTVGDLALMLDAEADLAKEDPLSTPRGAELFVDAVDRPAKPKRVAFSPDLGITPVDPQVAELCRKAALGLAEQGVEVEEAAPDLRDAEEIFQTLRAYWYGLPLAGLLEKHRELIKPDLVWNIEKGLELSVSQVIQAEMARSRYYRRVVEFFENYDLLLCPTAVVQPFDYHTRFITELNGVEFHSYVSWLAITFAISLAACPALSVPCGFSQEGLPVGLQIVGPPRGERAVLGAGALVEQLAGVADNTPIDPKEG